MQYSSSRLSAPEPGPGDPFYHTLSKQMKKPFLKTHPDVPCSVLGEGIDDSVWYGACGNKPVRLKKANPDLRSDPNLPAVVLKEGIHRILRQPSVGNLPNRAPRVRAPSGRQSADRGPTAHVTQPSIAINRDLAFIPSIHPIRRAQPKTAIPRGQNGKKPSARETLLVGKRWDSEVAKAVQAFCGRHPNIAFPILKERINGFA